MDPLKPVTNTGDYKTASSEVEQNIPLAFRENSPIKDDFIIESDI